MICRHCGAQVADGKRFCTKCGQPLNASENTAAPENIAAAASEPQTQQEHRAAPTEEPVSKAADPSSERAAKEDPDDSPEYALPQTPLDKILPAAKEAGEMLREASQTVAEEGKKAAKESAQRAWYSFSAFCKGLPEKWKAFQHKKKAILGAVCVLALIVCGIALPKLFPSDSAAVDVAVDVASPTIETVPYNASNVLNGSRILVSGKHVYIACDDGLYRFKTDGTNGYCLSDDYYHNLQATDGYLYAIDSSDDFWRYAPEIGWQYLQSNVSQALIYDAEVYYIAYTDSKSTKSGLYRCSLDGSSVRMLIEGYFSSVQIDEGNLYALLTDGRLLCSDLEGDHVLEIWQNISGPSQIPVIYNGKAYCVLSPKELSGKNAEVLEDIFDNVYAIDLATGDYTLVLESGSFASFLGFGFALDPAQGLLYGTVQVDGKSTIVSVDLSTGAKNILYEDPFDQYRWNTVFVFEDVLALDESWGINLLADHPVSLYALDGGVLQQIMAPLAKSIAAVNGSLYFSTTDGVYRAQPDGSDLTKIAEGTHIELQTAGSDVYYYGPANGVPDVSGISRICETGTEFVQQGTLDAWTIMDNGTPVFANGEAICRGTEDSVYGTPIYSVNDLPSSIAADGEWLYTDIGHKLYRIAMTGTESELLYQANYNLSAIRLSDDGIYFCDSYNLMRFSSANSAETVAEKVKEYVLYNGTVYYTDRDLTAIYSMVPGASSSRKTLVQTSAVSLAVDGQRLYYCDLMDQGALYAMDLKTGECLRLFGDTKGAKNQADSVCANAPGQTNETFDTFYLPYQTGAFTLWGNSDTDGQASALGNTADSSSLSGNADMDGAAIAFGRFYESYINAIRAMDSSLLEYCSGPCAEEMTNRIFNQNKDYVFTIVSLRVDYSSMELRTENGMQTATFNTETYCIVYERNSGADAGDNLVPRRVKAIQDSASGAWYINEIISSHDRAPKVSSNAVDVYPYI